MRSLAYNVKPEAEGRSFSRRSVSVIAGSLLIITLLPFAGCGGGADVDSTTNTAATPGSKPTPAVALEAPKGLIKADPNPVPAGPGAVGKTTISWNTGTDMGLVGIYVATDKAPEAPFSGGAKQGSTAAPWIQADDHYDFRLYVGTGAARKLIDHVTVTRNK